MWISRLNKIPKCGRRASDETENETYSSYNYISYVSLILFLFFYFR